MATEVEVVLVLLLVGSFWKANGVGREEKLLSCYLKWCPPRVYTVPSY